MNLLFLLKKITTGSLAFLLALSLLGGYGLTAKAQTLGTTSIDGIDISIDPSNPSPGTNVSVNVQSYSTDLNGAMITWYVDGKSLAKGRGLKSINVTAPASGKSTQVIAAIDTVEGGNIRKVISIRPGDVDLIWETSGYIPPLFRGKTPVAYQNRIKFTAIPHFFDSTGKQINPGALLYKWSNGTTVLGDQSGYGKQSMTIQGSIIPRELDINVLVTSPDQKNTTGQAEIAIDAVKPSITFYPDDSLYGVMYNSAIADTFRFLHNEVKVLSVPYGFDINDSSLTYNWYINNVGQDNLTTNRSIILRVADGQQGSSGIELNMINNGENILQGATADFSAVFNTSKQASQSPTF